MVVTNIYGFVMALNRIIESFNSLIHINRLKTFFYYLNVHCLNSIIEKQYII